VSSDPYVYPATTVLRNALGIRNGAELRRVEAELTRIRAAQLVVRPLPGRYDLAQLQACHRALFTGLYEWAGQLRTLPVAKRDLFCLPQHIETYGRDVFARLARETAKSLPSTAGRRASICRGSYSTPHPGQRGAASTSRRHPTASRSSTSPRPPEWPPALRYTPSSPRRAR